MMSISPTRPSTCARLALAVCLLMAAFGGRPAVAQAPTPASAPQSTTEEVSAFASGLSVGADGWLDVTETVTYFFPTERHGFVRAIPFEYVIDGKRWQTPLVVESVTDVNHSAVPFSVSTNGALREVKIGSADKTVIGSQTYVIRYRVGGVVKRFTDHDEVYWNVTGNDWTVPLRRVSAVVTAPAGTVIAGPTPVCYVGAAGSVVQNCQKMVGQDRVDFAASGPLTVVVGFTPGVVPVVPLVKPPFPWRDFAGLLLPLAAAALMFAAWRNKGRDPAGRGTIVVQYDPPNGLPPAMMGTVVSERPHQHDVAATIVDLAVRGYLRIEEVEKPGLLFGASADYEFVRLKEQDSVQKLRPFESRVLSVVTGSGRHSLSALKDDHSLNLAMNDIKEKVSAACVEDGYFPESPTKTRGQYALAAVGVATVGFIGAAPLGMTRLPIYAVLTALVIIGFGWVMPRRTEKGVAAREHALGFKDYLATAEKYRLQWNESENVFEKYLPYAMAFGVVDKWTKAFATAALSQPTWYVGRSGAAFNAMVLNDAIGQMSSSLTSAMNSAPPQRSGGSGFSGGHVGGGFGGGGGHSW